MKKKLTSRKFWLALTNFITMLLVAFGVGQETSTQVAAIIMAGASVIAYILGEGMADAAGAAANEWGEAEDEAALDPDVVKELLRPPEEGENLTTILTT